MNDYNPIDLLFTGMEKLGPGGNVHTLHVLRLLPKQQFGVIVDAGCGSGRQTIALAKELGTPVHAVDTYEPFLNDLVRRSRKAGVEHLVHTHCMDMKDIPGLFQHIDLLWSEGAAYNIGFSNALTTWASAINPGGFAVVSELSWLRRAHIPDAVRGFFLSGYPEMQSLQQNIEIAKNAGYTVLTTYTLPERHGWKAITIFLKNARKPLPITRTRLSGILHLRPSKKSKSLRALKRVTGTSSMCFNAY